MSSRYVDHAFTITRMSRCLKDVPDQDLANEDLCVELFLKGKIDVQEIVDFGLLAVDVERIRRDIMRRPVSIPIRKTGESDGCGNY